MTTWTAEELSRIGGFRRALTMGVGRIRAGGPERDVSFEPHAAARPDIDTSGMAA